jgi:hypothetical protein
VIDTNLKITYSNLVKILNFKVIHTWSKKNISKEKKDLEEFLEKSRILANKMRNLESNRNKRKIEVDPNMKRKPRSQPD